MDIDTIKALTQLFNEAGLGVLEVEEGELRVRMESAAPAAAPVAVPAVMPALSVPVVAETSVDFNNANDIKSPMVGVFYEAPAPGEAPFVRVGSKVKKGDTLCIIEAMKLMNEINATCNGEIVDICVASGDVVEYGQTLFKIC